MRVLYMCILYIYIYNHYYKELARTIMEAEAEEFQNQQSTSQTLRRADGVIQFESKGLRTKMV